VVLDRRDVVDRLAQALVQEPLERGLLDVDQVGEVEDVLQTGIRLARTGRSDLSGQKKSLPWKNSSGAKSACRDGKRAGRRRNPPGYPKLPSVRKRSRRGRTLGRQGIVARPASSWEGWRGRLRPRAPPGRISRLSAGFVGSVFRRLSDLERVELERLLAGRVRADPGADPPRAGGDSQRHLGAREVAEALAARPVDAHRDGRRPEGATQLDATAARAELAGGPGRGAARGTGLAAVLVAVVVLVLRPDGGRRGDRRRRGARRGAAFAVAVVGGRPERDGRSDAGGEQREEQDLQLHGHLPCFAVTR